MPSYYLGQDAKLYYGAAGAAVGAMTEVSNVKDLTSNREKDTTDITTRANSGWRAKVGTLKDLSIDFQMLRKSGDDAFDAFEDAYFDNSEVELMVLTEDVSVSGSTGIKSTFIITSFTQPEGLEDALMVSVKAENSGTPTRVTI